MSERWMYVNEGPVHLDDVAHVKGEEPADVWCDLIEGVEEVWFAQHDDDRVVYEWRPGPELSVEQEERVRNSPLFQSLIEYVNKRGLER